MFWTNYERYCKQIDKSPNGVAADCGIASSGTVTGWRNGAVPRPRVVDALVKYFRANGLDIGVEDLFAEDETDEEMEVREMLRSRPEARILFHATKDAPASALLEAAALLTRYKEESKYK